MTGALLPIPGSGRVISYKIKYNSYNTEAVKKAGKRRPIKAVI